MIHEQSGQFERPAAGEPPKKYYVDDVEVIVATERVQYLDDDGKLITESLKDYTRKTVRKTYASLDAFLNAWNDADRKQAIIEELASHGVFLDELAEQVGRDYDAFDLVCHVAFDQPPLTRRERDIENDLVGIGGTRCADDGKSIRWLLGIKSSLVPVGQHLTGLEQASCSSHRQGTNASSAFQHISTERIHRRSCHSEFSMVYCLALFDSRSRNTRVEPTASRQPLLGIGTAPAPSAEPYSCCYKVSVHCWYMNIGGSVW